jgi:hypothetical protein
MVTAADRYARAESVYVDYARAHQAHQVFDFLVAHAEKRDEKSKRCVLVVGPSQSGKSTLIESYVAKLNTHDLLTQRQIPVLHVTLEANCTRKGLAESILEAICDHGYAQVSTCGTETTLLKRTRAYLKAAGVRLLVLDEFHHVINSDSDKVAYSVGETIKRMLIKGVCAIALVGTEAARGPFQANSQLAQRAEPPIELKPLTTDKADIALFARFVSEYLSKIEAECIIRNAVNLLDPETMNNIFQTSEGVLGRACNLIKAAIKFASLAQRDYLIMEDFALAAESAFSENRRSVNLFRARHR